ncbi:MAG: hypothetical protein IIU83_02705 [Fibrobacteraceae bacterium]|nr:hypothetical protein [Fibrobacteraceae bacterium]
MLLQKIKSFLHPFETVANIVNSQADIINAQLRQNLFDQKSLQLAEQALHSAERGFSSEKLCEEEIIVSLTSYGKRIYDVYLAIESIMQGSIKPNRIILWLSEEEFKNKELPLTLKNQTKRGLEIRFCKDIKSYKKLIFALNEFPNACIITIDDDLIYNFDLVENLIASHKINPNCIWANRIHEMTYNNNGSLKSYLQWNMCSQTNAQALKNNFFTGCGGTLFPPNSLHTETLNDDVFMNICPTADDVWFNAMARLKGTEIRKSFTHSLNGEDFVVNERLQSDGLCATNNNSENCRNDEQIKAVFEKYRINV